MIHAQVSVRFKKVRGSKAKDKSCGVAASDGPSLHILEENFCPLTLNIPHFEENICLHCPCRNCPLIMLSPELKTYRPKAQTTQIQVVRDNPIHGRRSMIEYELAKKTSTQQEPTCSRGWRHKLPVQAVTC